MTKPFSLLILLFAFAASAQNTRLNNHNRITWLTNTTTVRFAPKWGLHVEYQWRRTDGLRNWQQSLLRTGINYEASDRLQLRVGYAWAQTFPYGEIPLQAAGKPFPEQRTFEAITLTDKIGRVGLTHRLMLEQRWIGRYSNPSLEKTDEYVYSNRIRYMPRLQVPINRPTLTDKTLYAVAYDEILLAFGKNVNENVFDQNRLGLLIGYRFNPAFRIEGGFFQQLLQLTREVNGRNVFQYNNGILVNTYLNMDLRKKAR